MHHKKGIYKECTYDTVIAGIRLLLKLLLKPVNLVLLGHDFLLVGVWFRPQEPQLSFLAKKLILKGSDLLCLFIQHHPRASGLDMRGKVSYIPNI